LEDDSGVDMGRKDDISAKSESSSNGHNLKEKKEECEVELVRLLDHQDEETVLLEE
jgi:hypothetical protein